MTKSIISAYFPHNYRRRKNISFPFLYIAQKGQEWRQQGAIESRPARYQPPNTQCLPKVQKWWHSPLILEKLILYLFSSLLSPPLLRQYSFLTKIRPNRQLERRLLQPQTFQDLPAIPFFLRKLPAGPQ